MAGIRDVARKANVSISTASLVLNNNGYVSPETRARVMQAMEELRYVPNELARNLYHNRTNIVGIILPDISHPFFGAFAKYAEIELYKKGYKTMLCSTFREENGEKEYIDMLKRQMMDGIIMGAHSLTTEAYEGVEKPIVSLDRYINEKIPIVTSDHAKGGFLAARELLDGGCRNVVQLMGDRIVNTPSHERHVVFERTMNEAGVLVNSLQMQWPKWDFEIFEEMTRDLFEKFPHVDGIFGADLIAAAALREASKRGIRVPERLKIVAYDGTPIVHMGVLNVTAIRQNIEKLAQTSVELLIDEINGKTAKKKHYILDLELIKGETT